MKKIISILLTLLILCSFFTFTGCNCNGKVKNALVQTAISELKDGWTKFYSESDNPNCEKNIKIITMFWLL